ncbi:hypothetical protein DFH08DRAFT_953532 [Mycena albidolilacea]|uniref:Uncharacterized protein n=1 Tax=Mycena albidolilacea TaxID=1033008 RepID=A0AAD7EZH2_9AGAR|nr:hypothetical protein DFH08DRAFT_953532 [Mycena albidolilacea]
MVKVFVLILAALAASATARPISLGDLLDGLATDSANNTPDDATTDADDSNILPPGFTNFVHFTPWTGLSLVSNDAHDEQQADIASAKAAAATPEAAAGIDISASIAAASSSAAAAAATAIVNPLDPFAPERTTLTPEQIGQLSGLGAKFAIDQQSGDDEAAIDDNQAIEALVESGEATFGSG